MRQTRSDSATAAVQAAQNAAQGPLNPPEHVTLPDGALPYWHALMANRARHKWNDADLATAALLAVTQMQAVELMGDIEQAGAYYHQALGFDRIVWEYPGALFLSAGGYHHHLGTNTWAAGAPSAGENDARLLEWELVLPSGEDVERAGASLKEAGNEVRREGETVLSRDPWGTAVRLVPA